MFSETSSWTGKKKEIRLLCQQSLGGGVGRRIKIERKKRATYQMWLK